MGKRQHARKDEPRPTGKSLAERATRELAEQGATQSWSSGSKAGEARRLQRQIPHVSQSERTTFHEAKHARHCCARQPRERRADLLKVGLEICPELGSLGVHPLHISLNVDVGHLEVGASEAQGAAHVHAPGRDTHAQQDRPQKGEGDLARKQTLHNNLKFPRIRDELEQF